METQRKSTYYSAAAFLEREKGRVGERELGRLLVGSVVAREGEKATASSLQQPSAKR